MVFQYSLYIFYLARLDSTCDGSTCVQFHTFIQHSYEYLGYIEQIWCMFDVSTRNGFLCVFRAHEYGDRAQRDSFCLFFFFFLAWHFVVFHFHFNPCVCLLLFFFGDIIMAFLPSNMHGVCACLRKKVNWVRGVYHLFKNRQRIRRTSKEKIGKNVEQILCVRENSLSFALNVFCLFNG